MKKTGMIRMAERSNSWMPSLNMVSTPTVHSLGLRMETGWKSGMPNEKKRKKAFFVSGSGEHIIMLPVFFSKQYCPACLQDTHMPASNYNQHRKNAAARIHR